MRDYWGHRSLRNDSWHTGSVKNYELGEVQRRILTTLLPYDAHNQDAGMITSQLLFEVRGVEVGNSLYGRDYVLASSLRTSLAMLKKRGLVECPRRYLGLRGRPHIWRLTAAGRQLAASFVTAANPPA